jgi:hypothetical protein
MHPYLRTLYVSLLLVTALTFCCGFYRRAPLKGVYHQITYPEISDLISFEQDSFKREEKGCLSSSRARGTYTLKGGNLILYYCKYPVPKSYIEKYTTTYTINDTAYADTRIKIRIILMDAYGKKPWGFINTHLMRKNHKGIMPDVKSWDGVFEKELAPEDSVESIKFIFTGSYFYSIPLKLQAGRAYTVLVNLADQPFERYVEKGIDTLWNIRLGNNEFFYKYHSNDSTECHMIKCPGNTFCK